MSVINQVSQALEDYFFTEEIRSKLFYSEEECQFDLARWLQLTIPQAKVRLEYNVPLKMKCAKNGVHFPWEKNEHANVDIVVELEGLFFPIELKYITARVEVKHRVFDENISNTSLTNIHAKHRLYEIWRDVKRVELMCNLYEYVKEGFVILLTNQKSIYDPQLPHTDFSEFALVEQEFEKPTPYVHYPLDKKDKEYQGNKNKEKYPKLCFYAPYVPQVIENIDYAEALLDNKDPKFKVFKFELTKEPDYLDVMRNSFKESSLDKTEQRND